MPTASVVMTVWREPAKRTQRAFEALAAQRGLADGLEVVVAVDPTDGVTEIDRSARGTIRSIVVVENPGGARSAGLNRAARAATSPWICRVDARSRVPVDYVARCVALLEERDDAGVVGGVQCPTAPTDGVRARGIARALANPRALGGAPYRTGTQSQAVDTVYLGAFRRDELLAVGGYDERLEANEDFDLCQRYRSRGQVVWLDATLRIPYAARETFGAVWSQYVAFGRSKVRFWRATGERPNPRQRLALTLGAVVAGVGGALIAQRPLRILGLGALGVCALAVLDAVPRREPASAAVRIAALPAYCAIVGGWLAGVATEAVRPARASASGRVATA